MQGLPPRMLPVGCAAEHWDHLVASRTYQSDSPPDNGLVILEVDFCISAHSPWPSRSLYKSHQGLEEETGLMQREGFSPPNVSFISRPESELLCQLAFLQAKGSKSRWARSEDGHTSFHSTGFRAGLPATG